MSVLEAFSIASGLCSTGAGRLIANGLSFPSRTMSVLSEADGVRVITGGTMPVSVQTSAIGVASKGTPASGVDVRIHTVSFLSHNSISVLLTSPPYRIQW